MDTEPLPPAARHSPARDSAPATTGIADFRTAAPPVDCKKQAKTNQIKQLNQPARDGTSPAICFSPPLCGRRKKHSRRYS